MVGYYITMRLKQFWRFFSVNQFNPVLGMVLFAAIFTGASFMVFEKTSYAAWIYPALAVIALMELQSGKSNAFLKEHTDSRTYYRCKLAENFMLILPFVGILLAKQLFLQGVLLVAFVLPYSFYNIKIPKPKLKALKSPFLAHAVEWHYGFRMFAGVYLLHVLLLIPGVVSQNFYVYLVPFVILLFFMVTSYGVVEDKSFIWVYRDSAGQFLLKKFKAMAAGYGLSFALFAIVGAIFYSEHFALLLICLLAGFIALTGSLFIKYHFYPSEFIVQISQMMFIGLAIGGVINPAVMLLMVLVLVFSFFKARKKLQTILQC